MQNISNILNKAILAILAAVLATGCINEKYAMPEDLQSVTVQMNISQETLTKAAPATSIGAIEIFAYAGTGTDRRMVGHYYNASYTHAAVYVHLQLPQTGTHDVTFHVVALDAAAVAAGKTISLDDNISEVNLLSATSTDPASIYMTGSSVVALDVENVLPAPGAAAGEHSDHTLIGKVAVSLKRMISSVTVHAAKAQGNTQTVSIERIEWAYLKSYGYLFSQSDAVLTAVPGISSGTPYWTIGQEVTSNRTGAPEIHSDYQEIHSFLTFENPVGSDPLNWYISNGGGLALKVVYTGGEGIVYLPPMVRNTHYDIYCTIESDGSLNFEFIVADWEGEEEWTLDFAHPNYLSPVVPTGNHDGPKVAQMYYSATEEGAFSVDFWMSSPAGQTWTPTFEGGNATDYAIKVYDTATGTEFTPPVVAAEGKWYTIKLIPQKAENVNNTVKFSITYVPMWTETPDYLIINKEKVWGGDSEDYIIVTQVENN